MNRLAAAAWLELRIELRYRITLVAAVMTVLWTAVLLALPADAARVAGPFVLTVDTATFGAFFIAALFLFERGEGALAALSVSPLRFGEYLGVKVGTLTLLSVCSAIPIALAAGRGRADLAPVLLAVALMAVLFLVLDFALVVRHRTVTGFLAVAPWPLIPLIAGPLARLAGVAGHPLFLLIPTTGAADLLRAGLGMSAMAPASVVAAAGYLVVAIAAAVAAARWTFAREFTAPGRVHRRHRTHRRAMRRPRNPLAALVRIDTRTTLRSALLVIVLLGPILLAVALRVGYPWLTGYLHSRFGVDLTPYQPVVLASLVVLHVPLMIGMVGALLVLDDVDDGKVLVLRVSPVTLPRYLAYRVVSAGVAALGLLVSVPLSGLASLTASLVPALVLAAAQAPLIMLAAAAFAGNKVEGLALLKLLGVVPTAIAPAMWWLPAPATWPLRLLPPYWAVDVLWRPAVLGTAAGAVFTVLAGALLLRRTVNRLSGQ